MQNFTNLFSYDNASNQLEYFIKNKAAKYSKNRNFDFGFDRSCDVHAL